MTEAEVTEGRRARTKARNRAAIVAAGRHVFSTIGYDAANIRDIVRESGLSPGTFYNYFPDKDAVFRVIVDDVLGELRPRLVEVRRRATDLESFVLPAFRASVEVLARDAETLAIVERSAGAFRSSFFGGEQGEGLLAELARDLRSGQEAGLLPPFPPEVMAAAMVGAAVEVCTRFAQGEGTTLDALAELLGQVFLGGIERLAAR